MIEGYITISTIVIIILAFEIHELRGRIKKLEGYRIKERL